MRPKRCPIPGCHIAIPNDVAMCGIHWGMVPTEMRMEWLRSRLSAPVEKDRMNCRVIAHVKRLAPLRWNRKPVKHIKMDIE